MSETPTSIVVRSDSQVAEKLLSQAIEKGVPIETLERLLKMSQEINAAKAKQEFIEAMAKCQSDFPIIGKSITVRNKPEKGGGVRYKYAPLGLVIQQTKKAIGDNGFSYTFQSNGKTGVTCIVTHRGGHSQSNSFDATVDPEAYMNAPQKAASALSFAKRYAFLDAFGIVPADEDDDAQKGGGAATTKQSDLEIAAAMIKGANEVVKLVDFEAKIKGSKKYSKNEKESLVSMIANRTHEITGKV